MHRARKWAHWWIVGVLLVGTLVIWYAVCAEDRGGILTVAFFDVGQGDAIFIESPTGSQILIDGGPDRSVVRVLGRMMPFYDRTIDMLVVTNPDKDHFAGFLDVLRLYKVGAVIEPGTRGASAEYAVLGALVKETGVSHSLVRRGEIIDLGGGAALEIFFPDRVVAGVGTNEGSIVAKLTYGDTSFLFTGDTTEPVENYLAELDGARLKADVLKVAHHGSRTSTGVAFLGYAAPARAVISAGADNRYGHPHPEVFNHLKQFGIETLCTCTEGTIIMESDGSRVRVRK